MVGLINGRLGTAVVVLLLVAQLVLLLLSMDAGTFAKISIFCTGPASSRVGLLFGLLHVSFLALLLAGLLALRFTRLRLPYIGLLAAGLGMLTVQADLVSKGVLSCDGP
jgi:hypothetical protein